MTFRRAAAVAACAGFLALGIAGAVLRATGERGVFVGIEAVLGFVEGIMTGVVAAAVATLVARAASGLARPHRRSPAPARG